LTQSQVAERPWTAVRRRLRKNGRAANGQSSAVLIVTSRHRLWQRYGPDGVFAIERAIGRLVDAMAARGLSGALTYTDDSPLLSHLGVMTATTGDASGAARVVRDVSERLAWSDQPVGHVLILGGDDVVPMGRPENPTPEDSDELLSDHIYATNDSSGLIPVRSVGRIPDASLEFLLASLRHATDAHKRLAAGESLPLSPSAFGYSAAIWKRAARGVFETVGEPNRMRLSPPLTHRETPEPGLAGPRFRYFNLHGLADSPHWFGQRDPSFPADYPLFPVALRPVDIEPAPGAAVLSEACYGAHIRGRAVRDSVALTYLAGGALCFVGATCVAYGGLDGTLVAADLLAQRFWQAVLAGNPAGTALALAKRRLIEEALARQGYLDAEDEKSVLSFVLYGDPSLIHHEPSAWVERPSVDFGSRGAVELAEPAAVGTLPVRPIFKAKASDRAQARDATDRVREMKSANGPARAELEAVRRAIARRLPYFATGDVEVQTSAAPRRLIGKSAVGSAAASPLVVTLRKSGPTCSGAVCRTAVRVTVDRSGQIRKIVVSR
jgi:hypothetical protein